MDRVISAQSGTNARPFVAPNRNYICMEPPLAHAYKYPNNRTKDKVSLSREYDDGAVKYYIFVLMHF